MRAYIEANNQINVFELLAESLNTIKEDTKEYARSIFYSPEIRDFIISANQKNLREGLRPDGEYIEKVPEGNQQSGFYERLTVRNRSEGKSGYDQSQTAFVDLYKTGFFYKSIQVKAGSSELLEFSNDPKSVELQKIWGDILGISSEDLLYIIDVIQPKIIKFVNDKLKFKK